MRGSCLYVFQMLGQLEMEEEAEDRRHSLQRSQLEMERGDGGRERRRLVAAQSRLAESQVRQKCQETLREVERRREQAEEGERERQTKV